MVVHYPRTVWKICYAEHKETSKNIPPPQKKKRKKSGSGPEGLNTTSQTIVCFGRTLKNFVITIPDAFENIDIRNIEEAV